MQTRVDRRGPGGWRRGRSDGSQRRDDDQGHDGAANTRAHGRVVGDRGHRAPPCLADQCYLTARAGATPVSTVGVVERYGPRFAYGRAVLRRVPQVGCGRGLSG